MKVSVILTVYNREKYLEDCLASIVGQSLRDIEIICVNDGSKDSSLNILENFALVDKRIKIINQENKGAAEARNRGLEEARGEFVSILDSDDFFEKDMLELMYNEASKKNLDILITNSYDYDEEKNEKIIPRYHLKTQYLPKENGIFNYCDISEYVFNFSVGWAWDKLYKRSFLEKHNLKFQKIKNTEDALFVFLSLVFAQRISVFKDKYLISHRINTGKQLSETIENNPLCFVNAIYEIKKQLEHNNVYETVEKSFINWIMEHTVWQYRTSKSEVVKDKLLQEIYPAFGIKEKGEEYFYDKIAYERMCSII